MAISRWNPWGELFALTDSMDHLFQRSVVPARADSPGYLPLDVRQTDEAFFIEASVPGFSPDEVEITLDENVLTIRAAHRTESDESKGGYVRRERRVQSVFRQVGLPAEVRAEEISAAFENGVLTVTVPRAQRAQPRRIEIRPAGAQPQQVIEAAAAQS